MTISIIERKGLYLLFDSTRGTYRWASASRSDAKATIPKASVSSRENWLDNEMLDRALAGLVAKSEALDLDNTGAEPLGGI